MQKEVLRTDDARTVFTHSNWRVASVCTHIHPAFRHMRLAHAAAEPQTLLKGEHFGLPRMHEQFTTTT